MALDSLTLNSGTGGSELAADTMAGGERVQYSKLVSGEAASEVPVYTGNGTNTNSIRVTIASDCNWTAPANSGVIIGEVEIGAASVAAGDLAKAEDAAHASGDVGVMGLAVRKATPADSSGTDGDYEPLQMDNGKLWAQVGGSVAHDAAVGSNDNPVLLGGVAYATDGTAPGTAVAEADISRLKTDLDGRLLTNASHPYLFSATSNLSTAATTILIAAAGAGLSYYITDVMISSLTAQTTKITEDTAGTPVDKIEIIYTGANGNFSHHFATPIRCTANVNLGYITTAAVATSVTVSGYIAA